MRLRGLAAGLALLLATSAAAEGDPAAGREVFDRYCASCHGRGGAGGGPVGRTLKPPLPPLAGSYRLDADGDGQPGSDADLRRLLLDGAPRYGGSPLMARFPQLEEQPEHLEDVLAFLNTLRRP